MNTISVTDHKLLSPTLAKAVIAWTGNMDRETMFDLMTERMSYLAQPVEGSFRTLKPHIAVGFIRANREIRVLDNKKDASGVSQIRANYRVMSSNILMDNKDKTLWEVKEGPGGQFLARHGNENLAELIESSTNHQRQDVPKLSVITIAHAAKGEFASFCGTDGNMDYGFVTRTAPSKCEVMAMSTRSLTVVPYMMVASLNRVPIDRAVHKLVAKQMTQDDRKTEADYWRTLFSYAPDYAEQLVHYSNADAML